MILVSTKFAMVEELTLHSSATITQRRNEGRVFEFLRYFSRKFVYFRVINCSRMRKELLFRETKKCIEGRVLEDERYSRSVRLSYSINKDVFFCTFEAFKHEKIKQWGRADCLGGGVNIAPNFYYGSYARESYCILTFWYFLNIHILFKIAIINFIIYL